jgi:hypothetical protein
MENENKEEIIEQRDNVQELQDNLTGTIREVDDEIVNVKPEFEQIMNEVYDEASEDGKYLNNS